MSWFQPTIEERRKRWLVSRAKHKWYGRLRRDKCIVQVTLPKDLRFGAHEGLLVVELAGSTLLMKIPHGAILLETTI